MAAYTKPQLIRKYTEFSKTRSKNKDKIVTWITPLIDIET